MTLRRLIPALAVAALPAAAAPASAAACDRPARLTAHGHGLGAVTVSWTRTAAQRQAGAAYRVLRGGAVVGQTRRGAMVVHARPGSRITVRVGVVGAGGRAPACFTTLRVRVAVPARLPAPRALAAQASGARALVLSWQGVDGARAYRVTRSGSTVGQTRRTHLRVRVTPGTAVRLRVTAVGASGRLGAASKVLRLVAGTRAPGAVPGLAAPVVTGSGARLSWSPAAGGSAPVRAYRVFRDGEVVGQFRGTTADVRGLAQDRQYALAVAAVDSRGLLGPSSSVTVRTTLPPAATGHLHAFLLASTDASFRSLQRHYASVGTLYPTYFDCSASDPAAIRGEDDPLVSQWVRDRRIRLMPRFNCQRPSTLHRILTDDTVRPALISGLVDLVVESDYDGLNLDLEAGAATDRAALTAFVADLAAQLHRAGRTLTLDVSPKFRDDLTHPRSGIFDYPALAASADWIFVMAWGLHWTTSTPGPVVDEAWLGKVYDHIAGQPHHERFVMGQPLYGFDWPAGGGPAHPATALTVPQIADLVARTGAQPRYDATAGEWTASYTDAADVHHEVWWADTAGTGRRLAQAAAHGLGGVGVWRLGQEDPSFWSQPVLANP